MTLYREILRLHSQGISQRSIALSCSCSRNTVAKVVYRATELGLTWNQFSRKTDVELEEILSSQTTEQRITRKHPDLEYIHKELAKPGVTLKLLWTEYCGQCRAERELPLMYSQFCYYYQQYAQTKRATMHIPRKPAEQIEVDWAGKQATLVDPDTGSLTQVPVFVGVLSYSQYAYVEAFPDQKQESWINAHINMYRYFGGVSRILVPDNLKTGVVKASRDETVLNRVYREMAEHYDTAIIPARVRKPKDKPNAEGVVGHITTWIIAALRHRKVFTLQELNEAIQVRLDEYNNRPFQKKEGSRYSLFLEEEKPLLLPLPAAPYELATWKIATVQFNYHISVEKMHYSVPSEYIKQKVDIRLTQQLVEVFFNHKRVCSHRRLYGRPGQYSTTEAHMPEDHQNYLRWDRHRFLTWAEHIGPHTKITVEAILTAYKVEQQAYRSCLGLLKLAERYSPSRLEASCKRALSFTPTPSYKSVKTIVTSGQDTLPALERQETISKADEHGFVRGASYYGGDQ